MSSQSTPIQKLLNEEEEEKKLQDKNVPKEVQNVPQYPTQPMQPMSAVAQPPVQQSKKEFFGLKDFDYKSTLLIFAVLLAMTSSFYSTLSRTFINGSVGSEGRFTPMGTALAAVIGTLIYVVLKMFTKC